jgi:competence protein ComEC
VEPSDSIDAGRKRPAGRIHGGAAQWVALAASPGLLAGSHDERAQALLWLGAFLLWLLLLRHASRPRRRAGGWADGALLVMIFLLGASSRGAGHPPASIPPGLPELIVRGRCGESELGLAAGDLDVARDGRWHPISGRFLLVGAPRCAGPFVLRGRLAGLDDPPTLGLVDPLAPARVARFRGRIEVSAFWLTPAGAAAEPDPGWRARVRARLHARIAPCFPEREARLLEKILWNDEAPIDPSTSRVFRATGTVHLLAISGLHVSFLAFLIEFLLRLFIRSTALRLALSLAGLFAYAAFVGPLPSVVRSTVMAVCVLAGRGSGRRASAESALWIAWLAMAAVSPGTLFTAGARLSFAATAALLWRPDWGRRLEPLGASFAPTLATLGILWAHFGEASPSAVLANVIAVPAFAPVFVSYLWGLAWGSPDAPWLAALAWEPARLLSATWMAPLERMAALGEATTLRASCGEAAGLASCILVLGLLAHGRGARGRSAARRGRLCLALAVATATLTVLGPSRYRSNVSADLEAVVLSVGQGDAVLLRGPGGAVLVDTGPGGHDRMRGARSLAPALRFLGVGRLRAVFLTHGDEDHVGGFRGLLLAGIEVDTLYLSRGDQTELILPRKRVPPVRVLSAPWSRSMGTFDLELLAPRVERQENRGNEGSLVLRVEAGQRSLLLPGDLGESGEEELIREDRARPVDVLMAGHHGSRTSSSDGFCDRLKPCMVVVSCGVRNHHGHPAPETLARFARRGIPVHRTDREGSLFLRAQGGAMWVRSSGCRGWIPVL